MAYFALATISSYRVLRQNWKGRRRRSRRRLTFSTAESVSSDWIDRLAVTLFQMLAPVRLCSTLRRLGSLMEAWVEYFLITNFEKNALKMKKKDIVRN